MGLSGLATDVQTFSSLIKFKNNTYKLKEHRDIDARVFRDMVASTLYEHRFGPYFVQPLIAGLSEDKKTGELEPVIATYDYIGFIEKNYFAAGGTASDFLQGVCEAFYREDMNPDELFEAVSQCLLAAMERDSLSGWGANVYVLTKDEVIVKSIKTRMD